MISVNLPFVSLVVVNYNGEDIIKTCLNSLIKIDYPKDKHEIIVVDNASTDKSVSIIKNFFSVRLIQNKENLGYVGVNSSLKKVQGEYIFILNNDIELKRNCLKDAVDVIRKDDSIGVIAPKLINYYSRKAESSGTWVSRSFYSGHYSDPSEKKKIKEIPYQGVELIRTDITKKFGYIYDPDYFIYAEDLDLSLRFRLLGYKTVYVPEAIIYHMHAATTKKAKSHKMTFLMEKNLLTTFLKVCSLKNLFLLLPYVIIVRIAAASKDIISLNFMSSYSRIKAIFWTFFHLKIILSKRKTLQGMRVKDDRFLFKIFTEKYLFKKKVLF